MRVVTRRLLLSLALLLPTGCYREDVSSLRDFTFESPGVPWRLIESTRHVVAFEDGKGDTMDIVSEPWRGATDVRKLNLKKVMRNKGWIAEDRLERICGRLWGRFIVAHLNARHGSIMENLIVVRGHEFYSASYTRQPGAAANPGAQRSIRSFCP